MKDEKSFTQRQLPFMLNCNTGTDPNAKTIKENKKLELKDVMKCTSIEVNVEGGSGEELTPEAQEEILNEEY